MSKEIWEFFKINVSFFENLTEIFIINFVFLRNSKINYKNYFLLKLDNIFYDHLIKEIMFSRITLRSYKLESRISTQIVFISVTSDFCSGSAQALQHKRCLAAVAPTSTWRSRSAGDSRSHSASR